MWPNQGPVVNSKKFVMCSGQSVSAQGSAVKSIVFTTNREVGEDNPGVVEDNREVGDDN